MPARAGLLLIILLGVFGAAFAPAAVATPLPRLVLLDHHLDLPEGGAPVLKLDLRIPLEQLVFRRSGDRFAADIRLALRAERENDKHIESALYRETITRPDFLSSREPGGQFEGSYEMSLGPGKWRIEIQIYRKGDAEPWKRQIKIDVPEPGEGKFFLHGPSWLGRAGGTSLSEPFAYRDPWALGEATAHFADGLEGRATLECDLIYWEPPQGDVELLFTLEDDRGRLVGYANRSLSPIAGRNPIQWEISLAQVAMGAYLAEVEVLAPEGNLRVRGRLDVGLTAAAFGRGWEETLSLIHGLAEIEEWEVLSSAEEMARFNAWRAFWKRRDPNGEAFGNAYSEAFWRRFSSANERFSSAFQDGYKSDRGRIYLEFGEPDRVETFQDDRNFRVLLYWHYSRLGRVYIFEDRHGYENFTLIRISG